MKPILILDCDEVILDFIQPFTSWLQADRGVTLKLENYGLAGNLRDAGGALVEPQEIPGLLDGFFAHGQHLQRPNPGAVQALQSLARDVDIVVLTNITAGWRDRRIEILLGHGLDFPVFANDGPKGQRVAELAAGRPAVFVDDLPPHHKSAAQHAPAVGRLHMVADEALSRIVPTAEHAHARIDRWADAEHWIRNRLEGEA